MSEVTLWVCFGSEGEAVTGETLTIAWQNYRERVSEYTHIEDCQFYNLTNVKPSNVEYKLSPTKLLGYSHSRLFSVILFFVRLTRGNHVLHSSND